MSRNTRVRTQVTHRFVCARLWPCPWSLSLHPQLHTPRAAQGASGKGLRLPFVRGPTILPRPCSFQLDLSPEADLGWAWLGDFRYHPSDVPALTRRGPGV